MRISLSLLLALVWLGRAIPAPAATPPGFTIPDLTRSPDHRLGVLVPDEKRYDAGGKNQLVEIKTGRVLAILAGEPGMERMNHGGVAPSRWSEDSSLLLWQVEGKWFPRALVLVKVRDGKVDWQLDLLKSAQQEILSRAKKAAPKKYAAARRENAGSGSAYPDGFTVDLQTDGDENTPIVLPLRLHVTLTADPKGIEDYPAAARLNATLEAEAGADGTLKILEFKCDK